MRPLKIFTVPIIEEVKKVEENSIKVYPFASSKDFLERIQDEIPDLVVIKNHIDKKAEIVETIRSVRIGYIPIVLFAENMSEVVENEDFIDDFLTPDMDQEEMAIRIVLSHTRSERSSDLNPLTKLPGNTSILKFLERAIRHRGVSICYIDIDNFKPFNDRYGFWRGDELILMLSRVLKNTMDEMKLNRYFLGHIGGDDFVAVIPRGTEKSFCERIISRFKELAGLFMDEEDVKRGEFISKSREGVVKRFPLPSLSVAVVPVDDDKYSHPGQVAQIAAQIKSKIKNKGGGSFMVAEEL